MDTRSQSKPYDIFISHSSFDKPKAEQLAKELEAQGYQVWLDTREVLVGHNIVGEVYKGITNSRFMVVLLSKAACESKWVKEEFTSARMTEIEKSQVVILPAKIEDCEVPAPLKGKKYADFTKEWSIGFQELITAVDQHPKRQQNRLPAQTSASMHNPPNFSELDQWRKGLLPEIAAASFPQGQPFKDVLIGPINGDVISVEKTRLKPIVDASRVYLRRQGVPPFPYDKYPSTKEVRLQDGLRYVDTPTWPYHSQHFHFWQIDSRFRFLHHTYIDEDIPLSKAGNYQYLGCLARSWILKDITIPLVFAKNILLQETRLNSLGVKLVWGGLKNRKLLEIHPNRMDFFPNYQCQETEWSFESEITPYIDIPTEAKKAALDLFWLFRWGPQPEDLTLLERDLESFANGTFPQ